MTRSENGLAGAQSVAESRQPRLGGVALAVLVALLLSAVVVGVVGVVMGRNEVRHQVKRPVVAVDDDGGHDVDALNRDLPARS
ncbi:MAG: hypothetical protein OXN97_00240 [Bryobacterales bacterium]|nr:hypothetical protein [Bryobacterales bacterium]